jgi:cysteine-rich repeat protein
MDGVYYWSEFSKISRKEKLPFWPVLHFLGKKVQSVQTQYAILVSQRHNDKERMKPLLIPTALVVLAVLLASLLRVEGARTYGITSLGRTQCASFNNLDNEIGDDRGGIAVTPTTVFMNGDESIAALPATTLATDTTFNVADGIFSDLGDGSLWLLAFNATTPLNGDDIDGSKFITHLIPVNESLTRDYSRSVVQLSRSLDPSWPASESPKLFAGVRSFVFASAAEGSNQYSGLFYVSISTGHVKRIYPAEGAALPSATWAWHVTTGSIYMAENWAMWGVMEETAGVITLVACGYNDTSGNNPGVHRWHTDGSVGNTIFAGDLADDASMTVNYFAAGTGDDRWWTHAEGSTSVFTGGAYTDNEWLVSCPATHYSLCGNGHLDAGEACDDGNLTNGDGCNDACDRSSSSSMASPLGCLLALLSALRQM